MGELLGARVVGLTAIPPPESLDPDKNCPGGPTSWLVVRRPRLSFCSVPAEALAPSQCPGLRGIVSPAKTCPPLQVVMSITNEMAVVDRLPTRAFAHEQALLRQAQCCRPARDGIVLPERNLASFPRTNRPLKLSPGPPSPTKQTP